MAKSMLKGEMALYGDEFRGCLWDASLVIEDLCRYADIYKEKKGYEKNPWFCHTTDADGLWAGEEGRRRMGKGIKKKEQRVSDEVSMTWMY